MSFLGILSSLENQSSLKSKAIITENVWIQWWEKTHFFQKQLIDDISLYSLEFYNFNLHMGEIEK